MWYYQALWLLADIIEHLRGIVFITLGPEG